MQEGEHSQAWLTDLGVCVVELLLPRSQIFFTYSWLLCGRGQFLSLIWKSCFWGMWRHLEAQGLTWGRRQYWEIRSTCPKYISPSRGNMLSGGGDSGLLVWLRLVLGRTGALIRVCPPFVQNESFCKSGIFFFPFPMSCLGKNQRQIHPIQSAAFLRVRKPQRSIRRVTQWGPLPARRGRTAWARRSAWGTTKAASVPAYSLQQSADIIFVSFVLKMLGCLLLSLLFPGRASLSNVMSHTFIFYLFIFLSLDSSHDRKVIFVSGFFFF